MRRFCLLLALFSAAAGCRHLSFGRAVSDDELRLQAQIRAYYQEAARAFAAGDAAALTRLYDQAIGKPMTRDQIQAWGEKFFAEHGPASFSVKALEFERLGFQDAVVVLAYRVETKDGRGSFGGTERDVLAKKGKRWLMTSWEKLP